MSDERAIYKASHDTVLNGTVQHLEAVSDEQQIAVFTGAAAALFNLMFEGLREQGDTAAQAAAKTNYWWCGYGAHMMALNANRPPEQPTNKAPPMTDQPAGEAMEKLHYSLGGISTPRMEGDNLAILLCSHFDNPEQEENDETHWTPDAEAGCEEVLAAIRSHYAIASAPAQAGKVSRDDVIEECARVADTEYNEQARLATFHRMEGDYEIMDRRNAAARSSTNIAASIRALALRANRGEGE